MEKAQELYQQAHVLKDKNQLIYRGAFTPEAAFQLLLADPSAILVDVRTLHELNSLGMPDISPAQYLHIEWLHYPDQQLNPYFLSTLSQHVQHDTPLLFFCNSAVRSKKAAIFATQMGFNQAYDVLEGFQGWKIKPGKIKYPGE